MKSEEELKEILNAIQGMDDSEINSLKDAYVLKRTVEDGELCDDGESGLIKEFIQALNTADHYEEEFRRLVSALKDGTHPYYCYNSKIEGNAKLLYYPSHRVALYRNEYGDLIKTVIWVYDDDLPRYSKDYSTFPCWQHGGSMVEDSDIISDLNGIERMAQLCNRRMIDEKNLDWLADELLTEHRAELFHVAQ